MGSIAKQPDVILYDYQFAPNAQKGRNLLSKCGIPYRSCEQPFVQPHPDLLDLGVTYRRIPVNFIGKDGYCDNRVFTEAVQALAQDRALARGVADHAYESFGYRSFWVCLPLVPHEMLSKDMQKDREDLFAIFSRPDYPQLRPSALAELKHLLDIVENDFLAQGPWIGGEQCALADIHASWMIKWALQTLKLVEEPGFTRNDFPKAIKWIESLPTHDEAHAAQKVSPQDAAQSILNAEYSAADIGVDDQDPTGLKAGTKVGVAPNDDSKPLNTFQAGKLVGLNKREIVIELENSIRLHFPRIGYVIKQT